MSLPVRKQVGIGEKGKCGKSSSVWINSWYGLIILQEPQILGQCYSFHTNSVIYSTKTRGWIIGKNKKQILSKCFNAPIILWWVQVKVWSSAGEIFTLNGFFGSDSLQENQTLIGHLHVDETAVITEEVPNFLFLSVFPNWTMVHTLAAASRLTGWVNSVISNTYKNLQSDVPLGAWKIINVNLYRRVLHIEGVLWSFMFPRLKRSVTSVLPRSSTVTARSSGPTQGSAHHRHLEAWYFTATRPLKAPRDGSVSWYCSSLKPQNPVMNDTDHFSSALVLTSNQI